ncbi:MAG: hypothetical protein ABIK37_03645 [candidate division WOR-3 bacterium]
MSYISIAENILRKAQYHDFTGRFPSTFASLPGYPFALALFSMPLASVFPLGVVAVSCAALLVMFLATFLLLRSQLSRWQSLLGAVMVLTQPGVMLLAGSALSDLPFTALLLLYVMTLVRQSRLRWQLAAAGAMCLTRYIGVGVLLATVAVLLLQRNRRSLLLLLAAIPPAVYLAFNRAATRSVTPLTTVLADTVAGIMNSCGGPTMAAIIVVAIVALLVNRNDRTLVAVAAAAAGYYVTLVLSATFTHVADLHSRMALPGATLLLLGGYAFFTVRKTHVVSAVLAIAIVVSGGLYYAARMSGRVTADLGLNDERWHNSPAIALAQTYPDDKVFSSSPAAIWFVSGKRTRRIPYTNESLAPFVQAAREDSALVIYFAEYASNKRYVTPDNYVDDIPVRRTLVVGNDFCLVLGDGAQ